MNQFSPTYASQMFSYWWNWSTALKWPSFSSGLKWSLLLVKLTFRLLVVSTSWSIDPSKSDPPYKDSSFPPGGWLSSTTFLFLLKFVVTDFLITLSNINSFLLTILSTTTIILCTGIGPRGVSGDNASCSCPCGFSFVRVNANSSYPTALSFIIHC